MNCKLLLLLSAILCNTLCMSQRGDTLRKYLDEKLVFTSKNNSTYPGIAIRNGDHWMLVCLYPDTGVLVKAWYKDRDMKVKDGPFIFYHPGNKKAMEGFYVNDLHQGDWKFWYPNGQLKDSGMIKNNFLCGTWKSWYENGTLAAITTYPHTDSINDIARADRNESRKASLFRNDTTAFIKHGQWQAFYANGKPESRGYYINNIQEGDWEYFREDGSISTKEKYKNGKVAAMACYNEQGNLSDSFCSILKPPVPLLDRFTNLDDYALDHIVWPQEVLKNKRIQGIVKVQFTITKKGELSNFKVLSSPHDLLSKEVERFFKSLPPWSPAVSHNRVIDYPMQYEVPFMR